MTDREITQLPRSFFRRNCRRYIPKPSVLEERMQRIFDIGNQMKLKVRQMRKAFAYKLKANLTLS